MYNILVDIMQNGGIHEIYIQYGMNKAVKYTVRMQCGVGIGNRRWCRVLPGDRILMTGSGVTKTTQSSHGLLQKGRREADSQDPATERARGPAQGRSRHNRAHRPPTLPGRALGVGRQAGTGTTTRGRSRASDQVAVEVTEGRADEGRRGRTQPAEEGRGRPRTTRETRDGRTRKEDETRGRRERGQGQLI